MASHMEKGKDGESMACRFLSRRGFDIKFCNWRTGHYEIDIIAVHNGVVHFVEVKTRHSLEFGFPEESVSRRKMNHLKNAACSFLSNYPEYLKIQYDILSVLRLPGKPVDFLLIEDVD